MDRLRINNETINVNLSAIKENIRAATNSLTALSRRGLYRFGLLAPPTAETSAGAAAAPAAARDAAPAAARDAARDAAPKKNYNSG